MHTCVVITWAFFLSLVSTLALAAEPPCVAKFRFYTNQHTEGTLEAQPGKACTSRIWSAGDTTIRSIQVVQAPKNARVSMTSASSFRFAPRTGFSGEDSVVLRINTTKKANEHATSTLLLRVTVR
jgi:hypothetical protein